MRDAATQNRRRNERAKWWIFLRNGDGGDMLLNWRLRFMSVYVYTIAIFVSQLTATAVVTHPRRPTLSYFEEMTRCRHTKLHWRWPDIANGRSKFRNLCLFTFTRLQLLLRWRLRGCRRLLKWNVAKVKKHRQETPESIEIPQIRKFMLMKSSKTSRKTCFAAMNDIAIDSIAHCFFPYYHSQRLLFSPTKKIISRRPLTAPKNRDIHIVEFFVDSIYSKTRYYKKKILIFCF